MRYEQKLSDNKFENGIGRRFFNDLLVMHACRFVCGGQLEICTGERMIGLIAIEMIRSFLSNSYIHQVNMKISDETCRY